MQLLGSSQAIQLTRIISMGWKNFSAQARVYPLYRMAAVRRGPSSICGCGAGLYVGGIEIFSG